MAELDKSLASLNATVGAFLATAETVGPAWKVPRAPGKWSPSQVVEHVARIMEESAKVAAGEPSAFPTMNRVLQPILRLIFFKRILRKKDFPKSKAIEPMDPPIGPATPKDGRVRVQAALTRFDQACRARAARGEKVANPMFGPVKVEDFARFQEIHVRHHHLQLPPT
jgi:hypothetical protein